MKNLLDELKAKGLCTVTQAPADLVHLLSAERAARGGFYATRVGFVGVNASGVRFARSHNGFPAGVAETRERWSKTQKDFYHLHAECAGIFHAARMGYATRGANCYVTHPPCPGCMHALAISGFSRVVFLEQSLLERHDWRDDMIKSFQLARHHDIRVAIYEDNAKILAGADLTRTELQLKKLYDQLVPEARWSSHDQSAISPPAKPESPEWIEHPVISALLAAAKAGVALAGMGMVVDFLPECRAATAMIQAGIARIVVVNNGADLIDPRWGVASEIAVAADILKKDAHIALEPLSVTKNFANLLDATREGLKMPGLSLTRF